MPVLRVTVAPAPRPMPVLRVTVAKAICYLLPCTDSKFRLILQRRLRDIGDANPKLLNLECEEDVDAAWVASPARTA